MTDQYRRNVGIVLCNSKNSVLWCERADLRGQWQFPQGGIEEGESIIEAAKRELAEETSVSSTEVVAVIDTPLKYDFPPKVAERFHKKGQAMNWVLFRFVGSESEINLQTKEPEFRNWKWVDIDEALQKIVEFKKGVYLEMVRIFRPYLKKGFKNGSK